MRRSLILFGFASLLVLACTFASNAAGSSVLTVYGAGTLAVPFGQLDVLFEQQHPGVTVQPEFGGSVMLARQITDLHHSVDVLGVADYHVISKYLFAADSRPAYANWYVGFAGNAITFAYTDKSKYAKDVTPQSWYKVLARPGVEIGRSNPDTDPSGYQTLQMLSLAEHAYAAPGLKARILANAPLTNMRDTETSLISALQLGQIDYLAIYRSDAIQHKLNYIRLPAKLDLSNPDDAALYKAGIAQTNNGDLPGNPIVYAVTIPTNAPQSTLAAQYVALLLSPQGQQIMAQSGFRSIAPAIGVHDSKMPSNIRNAVTPWPAW
jgi:molybdate/tungstate transport system substrate-binding protein